MRFCLRCILYRSSRGTPYRIPIDESRRAATGAFEAKRFTVTEHGVDSSVGGEVAAVRSGYAMEAQRMSWPQSSNYRQAEMLAGSFAQICKTILKKSVSSRIIVVIDGHLTASKSFFSRLNNSLPTELAQSTAYSFNRYGSGKYPAVFNGSDADNTNVLQCGGSLYRFTFLGGKRRICFKAVFCCRASNIGF